MADHELPVERRAAYQEQLYYLKKYGQVVVEQPQCKETIEIYKQQKYFKREYNHDFQLRIKTNHKESQHWIYGDRVNRIIEKVNTQHKNQYFKV